MVEEKTAYWQPLIVSVEDIPYQRVLLETLQREEFLPAVGVLNSVPKEARLRSLQPMFEQGV